MNKETCSQKVPKVLSGGLVIGDVIIQEDCVSSFYGDTKMFFKHQWIEDDVDARPEWAEAYLNECYCNGLMVG